MKTAVRLFSLTAGRYSPVNIILKSKLLVNGIAQRNSRTLFSRFGQAVHAQRVERAEALGVEREAAQTEVERADS